MRKGLDQKPEAWIKYQGSFTAGSLISHERFDFHKCSGDFSIKGMGARTEILERSKICRFFLWFCWVNNPRLSFRWIGSKVPLFAYELGIRDGKFNPTLYGVFVHIVKDFLLNVGWPSTTSQHRKLMDHDTYDAFFHPKQALLTFPETNI